MVRGRGGVPEAAAMGYSDAQAAELYDVLNPWGPSDDFYLTRVLAAPSVLDVGCGTGTMLHRARAAGHAGRLVGVDPDRAALDVARRRRDIEWHEGTAASMEWQAEFELAAMMSHAFQFLVDDEELVASLAAIRRALVDGGRFVFETRNPALREWERWHSGDPHDVVDPSGRRLQVSWDVESVLGDVVTFTETLSTNDGDDTVLRVDTARLRFLDPDTLGTLLAGAGFAIEAQYGTWSGDPLEISSREIITCARAV